MATAVRCSPVGPFIDPSAKARFLQQFGAVQFDGYSLANAERAVAMLAAHGVPILAGTDASNPGTTQGASLHAELELLVESGLTPLQALAAATSVPAARFHLADRGRIAPGMRADLLLVRGDPTHDIRATRQIDGVWRGGVRFDREKYRCALDEAVAAARRAKPTGTVVGTISDFDHGVPSVSFGTGWSVTTDAPAGGKSTAAIAVEPDGANGSTGALRVTGEVAAGAWPWAGAMFTAAATGRAVADLSAADGVAFQARGDGRTYRLMVFAKRLGGPPTVRAFTAGPSWDAHSVTFEELGLDGTDIIAIAFSADGKPGAFAFSIDDVTLMPSRRSAPYQP